MSPFKIFGAMLIPCSFIAFALILANRLAQAAHPGGHDLSAFMVPAVGMLILGIGLMRHQKWAAILFFAVCGGLGIAQIVGSVLQVPMPRLLLGVVFGLMILAPCYFMIGGWKVLEKR